MDKPRKPRDDLAIFIDQELGDEDCWVMVCFNIHLEPGPLRKRAVKATRNQARRLLRIADWWEAKGK